MQGTGTVIQHMQAWKQESQFAEYLEEQDFFPSIPPPKVQNPQEDVKMLDYIFTSLRKLEPYLQGQGRQSEMRGLLDLIAFVRNLLTHLPARTVEDQFELLHPLRTWCLFLPISFLQRGRRDPDAMILLAHFYAVGLAVEPLFPAVGAAYFGSMSVGPIREIHKNLVHRAQTQAPTPSQWPLSLMEFPLEMVRHFRLRMGWRRADEVGLDSHAAGGQHYTHYSNEVYNHGQLGLGAFSSSGGSSSSHMHHMGNGHGGYGFGGGQLQIHPLDNEIFYEGVLWRG